MDKSKSQIRVTDTTKAALEQDERFCNYVRSSCVQVLETSFILFIILTFIHLIHFIVLN